MEYYEVGPDDKDENPGGQPEPELSPTPEDSDPDESNDSDARKA